MLEFYKTAKNGPSQWAQSYPHQAFASPSATLPTRLLSIGALRGSWLEMGRQYGERTARDIRAHFDLDWQDRVHNSESPWAVQRSVAERETYRSRYLERSWKELAAFSPELQQFLTGISEGADHELNKTFSAPSLPNYLKVLYLNESDSAVHPDWDFDQDGANRPDHGYRSWAENHDDQGDGCNGYWIPGAGSTNGHAYAQRAVQAGLNRSATVVSYVAIPSDERAAKFWGLGRAGCLGGLGAMMSDRGIAVLTTGAEGGDANDSLAPGVKDFLLGAYGVIFGLSPADAIARVIEGSAEYRALTGRSTVLGFRGSNVMFAGTDSAAVLESNARFHNVRSSGHLNEAGQDYLVIANHFVGSQSTDEDGHSRTDRPMLEFNPGRPGSRLRYATGESWVKENFGSISLNDAKDFAASHGLYRSDSSFISIPPSAGAQESGYESWCAHRWHDEGNSTSDGLGDDGNNITTIFDLTTREAWFVIGWPCHYAEWSMEWNHIGLDDYS